MKAPKKFARYLGLAQRFLKAGRLPGLLLSVLRKREKAGVAMSALGRDLQLLQGLCMAWWRGEYRAINPQALLAVVAGLLYFVAPFDALPDWLPLLGFVDDLAVLTWVMHRWRDELSAYQAWREAQAPDVLRVIERLPLDPRAAVHDGKLDD